MAPVPSVGQADTGADGAPLGVAEQTTAEVTPPPTLERTELSLALVAPSVVGAVSQAKAPVSQAEVAMTMTSQVQLDAAMVVSEGVALSMPPAAQAMAPEVGRTEEDTAGGFPGVVAVVERISWRSPLALMSGGSPSPMWGEPPL